MIARTAEFVALYLVAPAVMALAVPPDRLFPALLAVTALGIVLLRSTPGHAWSDLGLGAGRVDWAVVAGFTILAAGVAYAAVRVVSPGSLLALPRERPVLMLAIVLLYPPLSALPQELLYRALFFRRYAALLPGGTWPPLVLNAALFSYAHLMFWSWLVAAMTFAGGLVFAHAHAVRGSFAMAVILHGLAGIALFAMGLGAFFYSGDILRPL